MTSSMEGQPDSPRKRASISLPSALRPARVSISSYQMENAKKADAKDNDDVFSTSAKAFDTISPDGTAVKLQSSPLSATKRLYGADARSSRHIGGNASSSRISVGTSDVSTNKTSPSRRGQASLPSILPNSAFLTPRKPSHTPRYSQTNSPTSTPSSVARTALSTNDVDSSHKDKSPSHAPAFAEQQLQPSLFLANQPLNATRGKAQDSRGEPSSLFRSGSVSTHGRANASCVEGESNAGTLRGGFTEKHGRSESRQDTLRSKASAEPLISRNVANGNAQTTQRKNSRTGSITGLLGLRNSPQPSTSPRSRQESYTTQGPSMHTVQETAEKNRQSFTGAQPFDVGDARAHHQAGEQPIQSPEHTVVPVISSKTKKPMRNYQIYRELQKRHRHGGAYVNGNKEKPTNAALAYGSTDYGGNNRFLLRGRLVTSGDSPFPFIACLILSLILVGAFFAFESQWLWDASPTGFGNPGGKAIVIFFAYAALIMWTSMLRTSLRDPGIIVKGLDSEPDWESIAVPVGGEDDLTGTGMGQRPKLRYFRVRDENVSSKCESFSHLPM